MNFAWLTMLRYQCFNAILHGAQKIQELSILARSSLSSRSTCHKNLDPKTIILETELPHQASITLVQ